MEFEKRLKELEKINDQIAGGALGLKESIETFKRGMKLVEQCKKELTEAEQSVKKLIHVNEETGEPETEDFVLSSEE